MESMHPPMRVALFTETFLPTTDGVVTVLCLLLDHLRSSGVEAMIFVPGKAVNSYKGFPVYSMFGIPNPLYPETTLGIPGGRAYQALKKFDPTIVHIMNPWLSGVIGFRFARRLNKPVIMSFHTNLMETSQFYQLGFLQNILWKVHQYIYNRADFRLATSRAMVDLLTMHGFNSVALWQRGVDPQRFSPELRCEAMRNFLTDSHPERTILLYVGRTAAEKQIERLVHILRNIPNTHLSIVGDGPYRSKLESIFQGLSVTFTGYLHGNELSKAYASSDMFVFPSATETFGLVVAEAMASGLPVISSRVGGVPDLIQSGVNGYIFEVNDDNQMVAHVKELHENIERRLHLGKIAHQSIQHLTWSSIMDDLLQHYRRLSQYHPHLLQDREVNEVFTASDLTVPQMRQG